MPARATSRRTSGATSVPEVRVDPLTGLRSIIAADRAARPGAGLDPAPAAEPLDTEADLDRYLAA